MSSCNMQCQLFSQMRIFPAFLVCCFRRCHVIDRQVLARCRRLEAQSVEGTTRYSCQEQLCPYLIVKLLEKPCPSVFRGAVLPSLEGSLFLLVSRRVARPSVSRRVGHPSISGRVINPLIPIRVISSSVSERVVSPSTPFPEGPSVLSIKKE